ncbi:hypothetical protein SAMN02982929_02620 [Saccharopolyspora kobensis]|uniref:Small secreted domain DUF320 n=1 Tax=Saccharopolyspora kobensis TaxID=146035 RepID=A0A1H6BIE8_9PSEU|nr:hypothetical protein [Saccharopolyspora kobensis]SEG60518.1 hypothetical protein SAMN02982929_02620 [Saccharopolyspora kobensis]SFE88565.1 hypothetical protein SAMN05216506_115145 [Saccharopolyspora kobensis]
MRIATRVAGVAGAAALGVVTLGTAAFADSADNNGINVLDDNNISAVPVQLCGNNVAVIGAVVPVLSPQANDCVNAPVVDHPKY